MQTKSALKHRTLGALLAAALVVSTAPATHAAVPFPSKHFTYRADGKKLTEVLQDFASSQGLPVVIDPGVDGTVNANFNTGAEQFLAAMTRTYGVIWYFDGTTLFIYPSRAMQSRVFRMRGYDRQQVRQMLGSLGLGDARFPLRFDDANQTLLAYGPPRHIELVSTVLEQLERGNFDRVGKSITVVPLHYATAADRSFGNTTIPGLVSTLNNLFSSGQKKSDPVGDLAANSAAIGKEASDRMRAAQSTYGFKMTPNTPVSSDEGKRNDGARANELASARPVEAFDSERPYFQAEQSTNAIIVRGLPDRMKEYETLIHQLDVSQDLVEIEASIIDVSADDFDSLGIDWTFTADGVQRFSMTPGTPATSGGAVQDTLAGANITTLIGDAGRNLLNHIRALEGKGKAHILARPKVLGAVNRTATMTDKRVASVRVAGNLDASLYSVEAGTTLQVTPQIISYGDHREVRLSLSIQDGDFEGQTVDAVPVVKQTEIDTEAIVREGSSLLIGGISVESSSDGTTGIPLLSHIPLVGGLFRSTDKSHSHSERMFLLTPKIVAVGARNDTLPGVPGAAASVPMSVHKPAPVVDAKVVAVAHPPKTDAGATICAAQALGLATQCPADGAVR